MRTHNDRSTLAPECESDDLSYPAQGGWTTITVSVTVAGLCLLAAGCGPSFRQLRMEGQKALIKGEYAVAKDRFDRAHEKWPEDAQNLFDLGTVCMIYAKERLNDGDEPAGMREVDRAIEYFSRAIESHPGMQAALVGKNEALELRGYSDQALAQAEWAAAFVGPSAKQQLFLASELEERGDLDGAFLRYRQAVAMEPDNAGAHAAFARFLLRTNRTEPAISHLKRAYRLDPLERGVANLLTDLGEPLPRTTAPLPQ